MRTAGFRLPVNGMGLLLGLLAAYLWGDRSPAWLALGAALGYGAELSALRIAASERTPGARAIAFFLAFQTLLAALPFIALGGLLPLHAEAVEGFRGIELLVIPLGAALTTLLRFGRGRGRTLERRAGPRQGPQPGSRRWGWIFGAIGAVVVLGAVDTRLASPYSLDFLYLVPVLGVTWATGKRGGLLLAAFSAEARGIARGLSHAGELSPALIAVDSLLVAAGLASAALLLDLIQEGLERERTAARTDLLTGLINRKAFIERLEGEISRASRHPRPLSIAYVDLDGFKAVNDTYGHAAGDHVLRVIAGILRTSLRSEDVAARIGGDEFAILLPETDPDVAPAVVERVRREIEDRMAADERTVTCSVGLVTSVDPHASVDELLHRADSLMYQVKHGGKNALRQVVLAGPSDTSA